MVYLGSFRYYFACQIIRLITSQVSTRFLMTANSPRGREEKRREEKRREEKRREEKRREEKRAGDKTKMRAVLF